MDIDSPGRITDDLFDTQRDVLERFEIVTLDSDADARRPIGVRRAIRRWMPLGLPMLVWTCGPVGFLFGGVLQLINCLSPTINRPLRLALHDRRAFTVVVQTGTGSDGEHPESGSMAHSTPVGPPGGDGRNDTYNGGSR